MICMSSKPYPKIEVDENRDYAHMLLEDYAGSASEDTAIHLYLYQSLVLSRTFKELSEVLKKISTVEMKHMLILGQLIEALGVNPAFGVSQGKWLVPWSASYVDYASSIEDMLLLDISKEESAIANYRRHIRAIDDENIVGILKRIIEDEEIHLSIFYYFLNRIRK